MANNKQIGTEFERKVCEILSADGWWVHFISPDNRGAQPFDIIAVKEGRAIAADCKTCEGKIFSIDRLEDNQRLAFEKWQRCGNSEPMLFVKHRNEVFCIEYYELKLYKRIFLRERKPWCVLLETK